MNPPATRVWPRAPRFLMGEVKGNLPRVPSSRERRPGAPAMATRPGLRLLGHADAVRGLAK